MLIIRWVLGITALLMGGGMALCFVLYLLNGDDRWLGLTRRFRHWAYLLLLFWVNFEIWRTVALVIIHW